MLMVSKDALFRTGDSQSQIGDLAAPSDPRSSPMSPEIYSSVHSHLSSLGLGITRISSPGSLHPPSSVFKSLLDSTSISMAKTKISFLLTQRATMASAGSWLHTSLSTTSSTHQLEKWLFLKKGTVSSVTSQLKDSGGFLLSVGKVQLNQG